MYVLHPSAILWKMGVLEVFLRGLLILNPHLCHNSLFNAVLGVQIIGADTHVHTAGLHPSSSSVVKMDRSKLHYVS